MTLGAAPKPGGAPEPGPAGQEADDDALLPFGVELGGGIATSSGFALGGIEGGGNAFLVHLAERGSERVELGRVHGDPEAPAVTSAGERVVVVLGSSDAAGRTLKLGQWSHAAGASVEWGYEASKLGRAVSSVGLAIAEEHGLIVYEAEDTGRVFLADFAPADLRRPFEPRWLGVKDAEHPRVAARSGGFWLAWVRSLPEPKRAKPAASAAPTDPEERAVLEFGLRVIEVAQLDAKGRLLGAPVRLGEPRRQASLFDLAPLGSGGLLVASRPDSASPGAEGGAILLSRVGLDGSVEQERLDDDDIGAGVPALLADPAASPANTEPWLAVSSPSDATRFGLARGQRTQLEADPMLAGAELIAVNAGKFLSQRARGLRVELSVLSCQPAATPTTALPPK